MINLIFLSFLRTSVKVSDRFRNYFWAGRPVFFKPEKPVVNKRAVNGRPLKDRWAVIRPLSSEIRLGFLLAFFFILLTIVSAFLPKAVSHWLPQEFSGFLWAADRPTLRISGSSTLLPMTQRAAEIYLEKKPDLLLTVSGTGTGEGIRSLIDGNIDIADASRDLKPEERQRAAESGVELRRWTVALDCLAVIVHPDNPITNISMDQLKGIYDGSISNWSLLGGPDLVIVPVNRDSSSGTFEMWIEKILNGARHRRDVQVQSSSGGVAYAVSGNRHAVGYVSLGFLSDSVKALTVEGHQPSRETVAAGFYPITRELYMFVRGDCSKETEDFIRFIISPAGVEAIEEEGFLPPDLAVFQGQAQKTAEQTVSFGLLPTKSEGLAAWGDSACLKNLADYANWTDSAGWDVMAAGSDRFLIEPRSASPGLFGLGTGLDLRSISYGH
ncbi:MAG: PstS family phosphate ABC transporter substrate-binding protein [Deltaproteobacteria bacterium]|jgi:phosphate transport system substrate-binding protein|nr:PstS family phosphate ABC transporter substrate-binding protein [Deltaproteobacteria bacterium]